MEIIREPISKHAITAIVEKQFGTLVKAVVDVGRGIVAVGGELHADGEAALPQDGSRQEDLWGINLYPGKSVEEWIEYDSIINLRPSEGNSSRNVEDPQVRDKIRQIVQKLVS